jgi:hypothetical protein
MFLNYDDERKRPDSILTTESCPKGIVLSGSRIATYMLTLMIGVLFSMPIRTNAGGLTACP